MFTLYIYRLSASCTHISGLLHALAALAPTQLTPPSSAAGFSKATEENEDILPVTSYPCKWKAPKKRKQSNLKMADATFEKHMFGKITSKKRLRLEDFDPRPHKYRGNANTQLTAFLHQVRGMGLGISLLKDESTRCWNTVPMSSTTHAVPDDHVLKQSIDEFMKTICVTENEVREIEQRTRQQRKSPEWFSARRFRLTSSVFGEIFHRRAETLPDALVVRLLEQRQFTSPAVQWGIEHEPIALQAYLNYQHKNGHPGLTACSVGFHISCSHPFLGASPDAGAYDPSSVNEPYGFVEIKCPYTYRDDTPEAACDHSDFFCSLQTIAGVPKVRLRTSHNYYCQVQGQLGVGARPWCDFVVYTNKGLSIERILFDCEFWNNQLLPKLEEFYTKCFVPEIVSPIHKLGLPVRDLRKK